ncbi:hypothetical protein [Petrachloros mirabilis]
MHTKFLSAMIRSDMRRVGAIPVAWLILWMVVIPLIHVHPDADHHGFSGHVHGGIFHTVFSQDLDGEYGYHGPDAHEIQPPTLPVFGASPDFLNHPEMGFSFLSSSPDRLSAKQVFTEAVAAELALPIQPLLSCFKRPDCYPSPKSIHFANDLQGRAPPQSAA